jgi:hypothetical protein
VTARRPGAEEQRPGQGHDQVHSDNQGQCACTVTLKLAMVSRTPSPGRTGAYRQSTVTAGDTGKLPLLRPAASDDHWIPLNLKTS